MCTEGSVWGQTAAHKDLKEVQGFCLLEGSSRGGVWHRFSLLFTLNHTTFGRGCLGPSQADNSPEMCSGKPILMKDFQAAQSEVGPRTACLPSFSELSAREGPHLTSPVNSKFLWDSWWTVIKKGVRTATVLIPNTHGPREPGVVFYFFKISGIILRIDFFTNRSCFVHVNLGEGL